MVQSILVQDARSAKGHREKRSPDRRIVKLSDVPNPAPVDTIRRASKLTSSTCAHESCHRPPRCTNVARWTRTTENPGLARLDNGITSPVHGTWDMGHITSSLLSLSDENAEQHAAPNVGSFHTSTLRSTNRLGIVTLNAGYNRQMTRGSNLAPKRSQRLSLTYI